MKKAMTLVLALALSISLVLPALAADVELPITPEMETFTIMIDKEDMSQNGWSEKECVAFTEKQTNIHIEWIEVPHSGWKERVNLTFASGDLPDAIIGSGVDVVSNMDSLIALNEYVDRSAPNILQMFSDIPEMRGALTLSDGQFYSLPIGDADTKNEVNTEMWINQSWMDKLGLNMPTNIDEFHDILVAFRDQDPNGNGLKDEIPLLASASSGAANIDRLFGFFGTLDTDEHVRVENDQVIFTPAENTYFQALQWIHQLYSEGLINQEYFTEDYQQFLAKGNAETCIAGVALEWYIDNIILGSYVPDYTYMPLFDGPNGVTYWAREKMPQGTLNGFVITSACKNPEALVRWYDYINSDLDILNLWNYGPENLIWRYLDDGRWELFTDNVPEGSSSSQIRRTMGTGPRAPLYAYFRFRGPDVEKYADRITGKVEANQSYLKFAPAQAITSGFGLVDEEAERNMLLVDIDNYLTQFKANAIVNGITEEAWQKHIQTLSTLQIDEYTALWQSFYDAHK
ncbi:MAG: extracellular solute-binding protein [Eubacteriales bacterium]|nr:extracellular solute-binding protein [Eubacteriales bacterium]